MSDLDILHLSGLRNRPIAYNAEMQSGPAWLNFYRNAQIRAMAETIEWLERREYSFEELLELNYGGFFG